MTDTDFNPLNWYWQIGADAQNVYALEAVNLADAAETAINANASARAAVPHCKFDLCR